jgi:hypothetical protein
MNNINNIKQTASFRRAIINDKPLSEIEKFETLKDYSWKPAGYKLKLPTNLGTTPWGEIQCLTITKYKSEPYKASIYVNRINNEITANTIEELAELIVTKGWNKYVLPFDVFELNQQLTITLKDRSDRAKLTKANKEKAILEQAEKFLDDNISLYEDKEMSVYNFMKANNIKDEYYLKNNEIARLAGVFCKNHKIDVDTEDKDDGSWGAKLFPPIIIKSIIDAKLLIGKMEQNNEQQYH